MCEDRNGQALRDKLRHWGKGPWVDEPDYAIWHDSTHGLLCFMRRNRPGGYWCGYVAVPLGHPALLENQCYDVHGGITWRAQVEATLTKLAPATYQWVGFDCGHAGDYCPGTARIEFNGKVFARHGVYRDFGYVTRETEKLARQLYVECAPAWWLAYLQPCP